jgi:1-acyl-sn-glycerol-3-phosphate acyltransferase
VTHDLLPRTDRVAPLPTAALRLSRRVAAVLLRRWYDVRLVGEGQVPAHGPVVLVCNHIGLLDGPLLAAVAPRPVHGLVKREMFDGRGRGPLRALGQISVERSAVDPFAVRQALRVLRDDGVVSVYPEGSRGRGDVRHSRLGAAYLALVSGATVVPVAHLGTRTGAASVHAVPPRGSRLDVLFGAPLRASQDPVPWPRRRSEVAALAEGLRAGLAAHVQHAVRVTGRTLPDEPPDAVDDADGRRGHEVGPQTEGQAS